MPDYVPSNTKRYFVDYEGAMGHRTLQVRANDSISDAAIIAELARFLNAVKPAVHTSVHFNGLRVALKGSNVSNPVPGWTDIVGTSGASFTGDLYPRYFSYYGRAADGSRVRLSVYGSTLPIDVDYRFLVAENATVAAGHAVLATLPATFLTITAASPVWKQYANAGYNAYHQRKRRVTA